MHDLFHTHPSLGSYYGIPVAYGMPGAIGSPSLQSPVLNLASALNPMGAAGLGGAMGQPSVGYPAVSPFAAGLQNPLLAALSNPLMAAVLQSQLNPSLALAQQALAQQLASLINSPYQQYSQSQPFGQSGSPFGQQFGQTGSQFNQGFSQGASPFGQGVPTFGQGISPFGQGVSPFGQIGYPLAPQSWIGQQGGMPGAQPFPPQIHPLLSQLMGRPPQTAGISPMGW